MAARWDKGGKDYINCPLDKAQYQDFVQALIDGEKMPFKEWETDTPYFEGCMPIEVMAERGPETLRHGPMKPMGLDDPRTGRWPGAVRRGRTRPPPGSPGRTRSRTARRTAPRTRSPRPSRSR